MTAVDPNTFPKAEPDLKTLSLERSKEYEDFLKYVAQTTGHFSYSQLAIIWPAICQSAMQWILKEHKSVDFGFVVLHPSPLRANWKPILVALFPQLGPSLLGKSKAHKQGLLEAMGFFSKFFSAEMLSVARERYAIWGIEAELKKSWWRAMFRLEEHRFGQLGSVEYASYVARQINKIRSKMVRCYLAFLRQISYPCGAVKYSRTYRRPFLVPFVPKGRVRPVGDADVPVHVVVPRGQEQIVTPKLADCLETSPGLPEVSDLRPASTDMRITTNQSTPQ